MLMRVSVQGAVYPGHCGGSDCHRRKFCPHGDVVLATRKFHPWGEIQNPF